MGIDTLLNTSCQTLLTLLDHVRTKYNRLFPDEAIVSIKNNITFMMLQDVVVKEVRTRPSRELIVQRLGRYPSYLYGTVSSNRHLSVKVKSKEQPPDATFYQGAFR